MNANDVKLKLEGGEFEYIIFLVDG